MPRLLPLPSDTQALLTKWLQTWNTPELVARATIELSPRLTRSLGRCYPERRLIRIAVHVAESDNGNGNGNGNGLLHEVLCHELAHLAARELHGRDVRSHGAEWKALMRAAGYEPRTRLPAPPGAPRPTKRGKRRRFLYEHRCPVCQLYRTSKRVVRRWRCAACVDAGLDGELVVTRYLLRR